MELFHKIYSCYYQVVKHILMEAEKQPLTKKQIEALVREYGFQESTWIILPKLLQGEWALLQENENGTYRPSVSHVPEQPYTELQKSWMKALLFDSRISLFLNEEDRGELERLLSGTEPLYLPEDFYYFDRYRDRDPYESTNYQENFRTVLRALEENRALFIAYGGKKRLKKWEKEERGDEKTGKSESEKAENDKVGDKEAKWESGDSEKRELEDGIGENEAQWEEGDSTLIEALPYQLQYSSKDDKFRICCLQLYHGYFCRDTVLNLARIKACHFSRREAGGQPQSRRFRSSQKADEPVVIEISGERNSLERCMLHFASYEKHTEYNDEKNTYICSIYYDRADETELLIEILSFGPVIRVLGPEPFLARIRERVGRQHRMLYRKIE